MTGHNEGRVTADAAPEHNLSQDQDTAVALLAACLLAPARSVADVLDDCTVDDVELLDQPTAIALTVCHELANIRTKPAADIVSAELLRRGLYAGHSGNLVRSRILTAATITVWPELLAQYAAAVLARVFRARIAAFGAALAEGAFVAGESDLWELLVREGTRARRIRSQLDHIRAETSMA